MSKPDPPGPSSPREQRAAVEQLDADIEAEQRRLTAPDVAGMSVQKVTALKKSVHENVKAMRARRRRLVTTGRS